MHSVTSILLVTKARHAAAEATAAATINEAGLPAAAATVVEQIYAALSTRNG